LNARHRNAYRGVTMAGRLGRRYGEGVSDSGYNIAGGDIE